MVCLITSVDFFIYPTLYEASFSGQQELSELDYYFQDGGKTGAQRLKQDQIGTSCVTFGQK